MMEPERLSEVIHYDPGVAAYYVDNPGELDSTYYTGPGYFSPSDAYEHAREVWPDLWDDEYEQT